MAITKVFLTNDAPLPRRAGSRTDKFAESFRIGVEVFSNSPQITVLSYVSFEGEASFVPGGSVDVKLAGWKNRVVMFEPDTVLWIDDGATGKRIGNYHACPGCCTISYTLIHDMASKISGLRYLMYRCPKCHSEWHFDNV